MNKISNRLKTLVVVRGSIPEHLLDGILYVNSQGTRAHHLCACGCAKRVMTPLNEIEWKLTGTDNQPSLYPSVGNWNLHCKSHYLVRNGKIRWARQFSSSEIEAVRLKDLTPYQRTSWIEKVVDRIRRLITFFERG